MLYFALYLLDRQPDILLLSLVKDSRGVAAHEAGLVLFDGVFFSIIGCLGHLIITVEVALKIELAHVFFSGTGTPEPGPSVSEIARTVSFLT